MRKGRVFFYGDIRYLGYKGIYTMKSKIFKILGVVATIYWALTNQKSGGIVLTK